MIRSSIGKKIFNIFNILFMIVLMVVTLYPVLHVAFASVSNSTEIMSHRGLLLKPIGFTWDSYKMVFKNPMITKGFINTMFILLVGLSLSLLLTIIGAYFLSRKNVLWKNAVMFLITFTMFFNGGLIPYYLNVKGFGMDNTLWALIIPTAVNTFNIIIMRTSFMTIPFSLEESAKLDGAGHFIILFRIIIPLSLPVIMVILLYYAVDIWNSWFYAMVFIKTRSLYPIQLVLREILIQNDTSSMTNNAVFQDKANIGETVKYAVIMVVTLPILFVYPFLQRYFVKGVMIGAIKE